MANQPVSPPDLKSLLDLFKASIFQTMNCHAVATVQGFDSATQTVKATINYTKPVNGVQRPYPVLVSCPIITLTGGKSHLTFPITSGDTCLILFNDRDIDNWFSKGQSGATTTQRMHSFSDAIALVGLRSLNNVISPYDSTRTRLQNDQAYVGVGPTLLKLANNTYTLGSLLQNLLTELQNLTTALAALTVTGVTPGGGVSGVPVNAAAITSIGTQIGTTATQIAGLLE